MKGKSYRRLPPYFQQLFVVLLFALIPHKSFTQSFCASPNAPITDLFVVERTQFVSGTFGSISDLNVYVNITHTYIYDLDIYVQSPSGTLVHLFNGLLCGSEDNVITTFDDEGGALTCPPGSSTVPYAALSAFDGQRMNGTWTIYVVDSEPLDNGTLISWCLNPTMGGLNIDDGCPFSVQPNRVIADNASFTSQIVIGNTSGTISDLNVRISLNHTWIGDLVITLTSPAGTVVTLFNSGCGNYDNIQAYFDDEGGGLSCPPTGGVAIIPYNALSLVDGQSLNGTWTLSVGDNASGDTGTLLEWCLIPTLASSCTYGKNPLAPIIDNQTTSSQHFISGITGVITDLNVKVTLEHSWIGDLTISLTSPAGTVVSLFNRGCNSGRFHNIQTFFDDEGSPLTCPPIGGFLTLPAGSLTAFDGQNPNGTWTLTVTDNAGLDEGILYEWCLLPAVGQCAFNSQCDDGNPCTNDMCIAAVCRSACSLEITNPVYIANTVQGCNDGTVSASIVAGSCPAWDAYLYSGNNVLRSWNSGQGSNIFWSNVPGGNYLMVVTNHAGCADSLNIPIGAGQPCEIRINNAASTPASVRGCNDGSINAIINAFTCNGIWSATLFDGANHAVANWNYNMGTALLWENLPAGSYRINATDGGACTSNVDISIPDEVPCRVRIQNVQKTVSDCSANTVTADISSMTCSGIWYAYLYDSNFFNYIATWSSAQGSNIEWTDIPLGNYHIYATNDFASCSDTFGVSLSCSDNDPCTNDHCTGGCSHSPKCEDNNPCTVDFCQAGGVCLNQPIICNDGNPCTSDACVGGNCISTPINCADNNLCTVDQCFNGSCTHVPMNCNDNNSCTSDFCQGGSCFHMPVCVVDDNNPCTDDYCVNRTCLHVLKNCDDFNLCTNDVCVNGICQNNPICILDDGINCTQDRCLNGSCLHIDTCITSQCQNNPGICSDSDPCTIDTCISNACTYLPATCDDGNSCTADACDAGNCVHTPACPIDDGNPCTNDGCINGQCFHVPKNCNDFNDCTRDTCIGGTCVFQPLCLLDDGDLCTNDFCLGGQCVHQPVFCNDGNLCTDDTCRNGQCVFEALVCSDGNPCTQDSCLTGNCIFPLIPNCINPCDTLHCEDSDMCTIDSCSNGACLHRDTCCVVQHISLSPGWNTISGYVIPDNPSLPSVFSSIVSSILIVKNNAGQAYIPAFGINTIGSWDFRQGYKVKTNGATTLSLGCTPANPSTPISLNSGWSMIAYLRSTPLNTATAMASLGNTLLIVKNNSGQTYIPAFGINTIGNMLPGQGYQLKLSSGGTLIYPAPRIADNPDWEQSPVPQYFDVSLNTGSNATIIFPPGALDASVAPKDEIAVLTGDGRVAGAAVAESKAFALTVWGDDLTTPDRVEGMLENESFRFVHWSAQTGLVMPLALTFSDGPDRYFPNGISIAVQQKTTQIGTPPADVWIKCFPNPAAGIVFIEIFLPQSAASAALSVYDYTGRKVKSIKAAELQQGLNLLENDMAEYAQGQYVIELSTEMQVKREKFVLIK